MLDHFMKIWGEVKHICFSVLSVSYVFKLSILISLLTKFSRLSYRKLTLLRSDLWIFSLSLSLSLLFDRSSRLYMVKKILFPTTTIIWCNSQNCLSNISKGYNILPLMKIHPLVYFPVWLIYKKTSFISFKNQSFPDRENLQNIDLGGWWGVTSITFIRFPPFGFYKDTIMLPYCDA